MEWVLINILLLINTSKRYSKVNIKNISDSGLYKFCTDFVQNFILCKDVIISYITQIKHMS
jgi:hypothetical protein